MITLMSTRRLLSAFFLLAARLASAQSRPAFEVASVKPCHDGDTFTGITNSPTRLTMGCLSLETLISLSYIQFADGHYDPFSTAVLEGGPPWIKGTAPVSDRYAIDAEASEPTAPQIMRGPMLQSLLEERFQLKVHRETRQVHVYALTVDKGGARLKPFDGGCTARDFTKVEQPQLSSGQKPLCGGATFRGNPVKMDLPDATMANLADRIDTVAERMGIIDGPVIDRTGLNGRFDIHLEFANGSENGEGASLFTAVKEQLGLKLERTTGPREFVVVDRIERASGN